MAALVVSCGSTTTRHDGMATGGIANVERVQLEDMEFTVSNLVGALDSSGILDINKTIFFNKSEQPTATSGVDNKTTTNMERNGHRIQLSNYLVNDLIKRKMCKVVTTARGYNTANYSLKVLLVNEHSTGDKKWIGERDQSNRIVIHFELYDIESGSENIVFASSEIVQKLRN